MTKFLSNLFGIILILGAAALMGCSLYRSDGRKSLQESARTASGKSFIVQWEWQCDEHHSCYWVENTYYTPDL